MKQRISSRIIPARNLEQTSYHRYQPRVVVSSPRGLFVGRSCPEFLCRRRGRLTRIEARKEALRKQWGHASVLERLRGNKAKSFEKSLAEILCFMPIVQ